LKIKLKVYGNFKQYLNSGEYKIEENLSVEDFIDRYNVPKEVKYYMVILVNNKKVTLKYKLNDGDEVSLFQPVGGG